MCSAHAEDVLLTTLVQVEWARRQYYGLLSALRPDGVGLVDGLGLTDYLLNSALGRADGDVYRALLAAAQVGLLFNHSTPKASECDPQTLVSCALGRHESSESRALVAAA